MDINWPGLISIIIFYIAILVVGIWAAKKKGSTSEEGEDPANDQSESEEVMLAGRSIGMFVGTFTMTATWVGGGYINGTAESVYKDGLVWAQAPWGYATSLILGGIIFAKPMRNAGYITMVDPLQDKYGKVMGGILYVPALLGETFWSAAILAALGATLTVIMDIDMEISVIASALIAVGYTFFGGLYSVAYTDVIQLFCIFVGLWLALPFCLAHEHTANVASTSDQWIGKIHGREWGKWIDHALLLMFGGIPWQVYFQRVLSSKSAKSAQILSFIAAGGCIFLAIPAVLIGAVAKSTVWDSTEAGNNADQVFNGSIIDTRLTLPMVLQHLTPTWVSFVGLGAVSAAVMSSADSSVLSAASMFAHNIWKIVFRKEASSREIIWVIRVAIFAVGAFATYIGLTVKSIYALWTLCSDLVFVILFPQLVGAVHIEKVNTYGSAAAYIVALVLRCGGGEELIGLKPFISFPWMDETTKEQFFPFRTLTMCISFFTLVSVSYLFDYLLETGIISEENDYFQTLQRKQKNEQRNQKLQDIVMTKNEKVNHGYVA